MTSDLWWNPGPHFHVFWLAFFSRWSPFCAMASKAMTNKGAVLFTDMLRFWFLVSQYGHDSGCFACVSFKSNGEPEETFWRRAYKMWAGFLHYCELGRGTWELDDGGEGEWKGIQQRNTWPQSSYFVAAILIITNLRFFLYILHFIHYLPSKFLSS